MTHSVELLFDTEGDAAIRSLWQALADAGLPSQLRVRSPTNRPHVTLLAAGQIGPGADAGLRGLADRLPMRVTVGAALVFGGSRPVPLVPFVLARLIVPSAGLLDLHAEIWRRTSPHVGGEPFGHCRPGHWTPHATLGRRLDGDQIGAALAVVNAAGGDLAAQVTGLRRWDGDERVEHLLVG